MKTKNIPLLIFITILAIAFITGTIYIIISTINNNMYKNEDNQISLFSQILDEFTQNNSDYKDCITLDDSMLRNFITKEFYSDENITKLKNYEGTNTDYKQAILSVNYEKTDNILSLNVNIIENGENSSNLNYQYKLSLNEKKITYKNVSED